MLGGGVTLLFPCAGSHLAGCPEVSLVLLEASAFPGSSVPLGDQGSGRCWPPAVAPPGQCFANLTERRNRLEGAESRFAGLTLEFLAGEPT